MSIRLRLESYWRIGKAEAVVLGTPKQRSKTITANAANDEVFALAA